MAQQRSGTIFSNILGALRGNRTGTDAEKSREKLLTNQPTSPYKNVENQQQDFLDVQSSKIAYDLYSRSVYYDTDRLSAYNDFKAMDSSPEISAALDIMTDEVCLEENTIIPLLNGTKIKIKDLFKEGYKDFWVYSFDTNKQRIIPAKCEKVIYKGEKNVYEITFDDDSKVMATSDHKWLLRGKNEYLTTKELNVGQSLQPIYSRMSNKSDRINGYEMLLENGKWEYTHRIVKENIYPNENGVTHHVDFCKTNNVPENLKIMNYFEHQNLHASMNSERWKNNESFREKMIKIFKSNGENWKNFEWAEKTKASFSIGQKKRWDKATEKEKKEHGRSGELNGMFKNGSKLEGNKNGKYRDDVKRNFSLEELLEARHNTNSFEEAANYLNTTKTILRYCESYQKLNLQRWEDIDFLEMGLNNESLKKACLEYECKNINRTYAKICEQNGWKQSKVTSFLNKNDYKNFSEFVGSINHSIKEIKYVGKRPVYDMVNVGEYNNFAILTSENSGVFTHNCTRSEKGDILQIFSNNARIKNVLKDLFHNTLNIDYNLMFWSREMMKYGDFFLKLEIDKEVGIYDCRAMPPAEIHREEAYDGNLNSAKFRWDLNNMFFEEWQVAHFRIATDGARLPYGRCLKWDTYIETDTGVKFIKDIIPGKDKVYSFDTKTQKRILSNVLDKVCSGKKEIYKIRTKNNELESSIEHKIMIYDKNLCDFKYKYVSELNIGDLFVINKKTETNNLIKIDKEIYEDINKNGYRKKLNLIPEYVDEEFAMLFGFMLGDGWINNNNVCFALGVEDDINEKYVNLLEKFSGNKVNFVKNKNQEGKLYFSQVTCSSKMLKKILQKNGFIGNVYSKRFPEWIFNAEKNIQEAFMKGLYEADGSINVDKWNCKRYSLELTNEYMVKDAKILLQRLGKKSGKVSSRNRDKTIFWNKESSKKESFYFYYYDSEIKQKQKYDILNRLTDNFIIEPITSIEKTSKLEDVYDIHVENENHNFYANGIVVHNSILESARKLWKQLQLAEDAMLVYRLIRAPERRVYYIEVGNTEPKDIPQYMEKMKASMKKNYVVDPSTGQMNLKYNPITYEEDFFIPIRGDKSSKIETLQGAANLNDIADVEYLQNKLFAAIKVPRAYLNYADKLEGGSTLAQADLRFARTVNRMQEAILLELRRIASIHLYFLGFEDDMDNFSLKLTNPSTQQELLKLEVMKLRLEVFKEMFTPEATSPTSYTYAMQNILGFSDSEIKLILKQKKVEKKMFMEIEEAGESYKKTGIFKDIDKKFTKGLGDEEDTGVAPGETEGGDTSGGGGGSFADAGLGGSEENPFGGEDDTEGAETEPGTEGEDDTAGLSESVLITENKKLSAITRNLLKNLDRKYKINEE